ncbi:MAG: hypothetical protein RLZZ214_3765 [Verrucomicrobiota bacterium]
MDANRSFATQPPCKAITAEANESIVLVRTNNYSGRRRTPPAARDARDEIMNRNSEIRTTEDSEHTEMKRVEREAFTQKVEIPDSVTISFSVWSESSVVPPSFLSGWITHPTKKPHPVTGCGFSDRWNSDHARCVHAGRRTISPPLSADSWARMPVQVMFALSIAFG